MKINKHYCSSVLRVHLYRDKEFGYRNALTGNIRRCSKHRRGRHAKISIFMIDILMNVDCYSLLRAIRAINDVPYNETTTHTQRDFTGKYIYILRIYILNVIKLSKDIYIEAKDWAERDNLQMTIDARKIISNLDMPLENVKWEALQNVK